jgi:hypothetical protein
MWSGALTYTQLLMEDRVPRRITYLRRGSRRRVQGWDEKPSSVARARSVVVARTRARGTLEQRSTDSPFLRRTRVVQVSSPPQPPGEGRIANFGLRIAKFEIRNPKSEIRNPQCEMRFRTAPGPRERLPYSCGSCLEGRPPLGGWECHFGRTRIIRVERKEQESGKGGG